MKNLRIHTASLFLIATLALSISCKEESTGQNDSESYIYQLPLQVNDGWEVAHVNQAGINQDFITRMMEYLGNSQQHRIHNILIIKENKLVFEEYFDGYLYGTNPPGSDGLI